MSSDVDGWIIVLRTPVEAAENLQSRENDGSRTGSDHRVDLLVPFLQRNKKRLTHRYSIIDGSRMMVSYPARSSSVMIPPLSWTALTILAAIDEFP